MARQRRGGFRPPELRGTLGTLLRTTWQQAGVVREALERGAREGKSRLDEVRSSRRRQDALAELGELVLDLIRRGEIDLGELPEAQEIVRQLDDLDEDSEAEPATEPEIAHPPSRRRFDDRADGTVSSASARSMPTRKTAPMKVWRPPVENDEPTIPAPSRRAPPRDPARKGGIAFDHDDDDSDLADYMHPDDVPPKPPTDGES